MGFVFILYNAFTKEGVNMLDREYLLECRNELFDDIIRFREMFGNRSLDDVMILIEKREKELRSKDLFVREVASEFELAPKKVGGEFTVEDFISRDFTRYGIPDDYEVVAEKLLEIKKNITTLCQSLNDHAERLAEVEDHTFLGCNEPSIKDYTITISSDKEVYGVNAYKNDVIKHAKDKRLKLEQIVESAENMSEQNNKQDKQETKQM